VVIVFLLRLLIILPSLVTFLFYVTFIITVVNPNCRFNKLSKII
jgi:hypothetical protein